jgi:hypothetical protein
MSLIYDGKRTIVKMFIASRLITRKGKNPEWPISINNEEV